MAKTSKDARRIIKGYDRLGRWERLALDVLLALAALACLVRWIIDAINGQ